MNGDLTGRVVQYGIRLAEVQAVRVVNGITGLQLITLDTRTPFWASLNQITEPRKATS